MLTLSSGKRIRLGRFNWRIFALAVAICGLAGGAYYYSAASPSPLPASIQADLTFSPFVIPRSAAHYSSTDFKFSTAENKVQILSYLIHTENHGVISISEYAQPPEFTEVPEYKDRFLTNVSKQYATVQTANGTIYLGRLARQNDKQLGVMLEKGLLVFLSPARELDQAAWRNLGDQLEVQKVVVD